MSKQNINKPELNVLQGQRIHTLLHPCSALSLIDNLPALSESLIFTTGTACSENLMHLLRAHTAQIKLVRQKALFMHAVLAVVPVVNKNKAQICCSECTSRTGYCSTCQLPFKLLKLHHCYRPLLCFSRELIPRHKKSGRAPECRGNADL